MKVGTDSILLGAWADVSDITGKILDIGSGSGLLALMLAQRTTDSVQIDAVELDDNAALQATENFAQSPWASRMALHHSALQSFAAQTPSRYDLIITNPPYYQPGVECRNASRDTARYTSELSHQTLLKHARTLASDKGKMAVVLPCDISVDFIELAAREGWFLLQHTEVTEFAHRAAHRALMLFGLEHATQQSDRLIIRDESKVYSNDFRELTKAFYLFSEFDDVKKAQ
ncbi:tRNA1(Val) (adenine(37)-N6)-methyltransferase [Obesumbacterium proteus]|uniref:tRNA1(Val) (adenine(37)-N6)-methyltransferase n=1 Tax=Obesumbacterium proteus TaxID=82983 RepID=UPI001F329A85|nr:methyltransferase [Obesumbacterium proteus]MCE9886711.1 methyltransferase [Obesumbacterium proteus]MCE9916240.1 methyltransferase [Obesumbacterium proteus]MCE9931703.1 methyltransferase [Obesumbacterium proteus]MCG2878079.1 methyltransferase [Obesumbacterium proteus]